MRIGIPKEVLNGERRVAATPDTVKKMIKMGFEVSVEAGAGALANYPDQMFTAAGASITSDVHSLWSSSDLICKINPPQARSDGSHEANLLADRGTLISLLFPEQNPELVEHLQSGSKTAIALDMIPRITRAQKMDVLSSMANIAGYRAVLEAAHLYGGFFGGQITAAGKTRPAQVLVIGAGVAGLAAIGTARGLGAEVRAFDVRPACKEQVESMGARFLMLDVPMDESQESSGGYANIMSDEFLKAELECFANQAKEVDIIITTALIPGRKAPELILQDMIDSMKPGSVIMDLAAEQGGNCTATVPGQVVVSSGVHVVGYTDLTSRLPTHASQFFGTNIVNLLSDMGGAGDFKVDFEDEVVRKSTVVRQGTLTWPPPPDPEKPPVMSQGKQDSEVVADLPQTKKSSGHGHGASNEPMAIGPRNAIALTLAVVLALIGFTAESAPVPHFVQQVTVFLLACFIGWQVVWSVTPALHTPLMSVTNAISGIIVVGGLLGVAGTELNTAAVLGAVAILVASINIAGGFLVTQRMLQMFRKEDN